MLPQRLDQIDEQVLSALCTAGAPESQLLEFKRDLPERSDKGREELLKDIAGFANAEGGDLVYGVVEAKGCASALHPIKTETADAAKRRLAQILEAGIEPRVLGLQMHDVRLGAEGAYALIVRVPASFDGPHWYEHKGHRRFVIRVGTHTAEMTYPQVRAAFDRTATLSERARQFRIERLAIIESDQAWRPLEPGPLCALHLIPIAAMAGRTGVDITALYCGNYDRFGIPEWGGAHRTLNLDGLVVHPAIHGQSPTPTYVQVFRSGALEAVRYARSSDDQPMIWSGVVSNYFRSTAQQFIKAARDFGFAGPAVLGASLLRASGYNFAVPEAYQSPLRPPADRHNLVLPETWIERVEDVDDIDTIARPLLDLLWQGFNIPRCAHYDKDGKWKPPR